MNNYEIYEEISQSRLSKIYKAKNKNTKEIVALKVVTETKAEESPSKDTLREMLVLMNFEHENIVGFRNVFVSKISIVFEMEYCITDLNKVIKTLVKPFTRNQIKKIIFSIAQGLNFLHTNDIIHRDVKTGNVLIDENCDVKICDFGSSRIYIKDKQFSPNIGTKWYKSPEILLGKKNYNKKVDVWSLGCIMAELYLLEPLFPGGSDIEMLGLIFEKLGYSFEDDEAIKPEYAMLIQEKTSNLKDAFDQICDTAFDLLKNMLVVNPNDRYTINDVINHDFFKIHDFINVHLPL